MNNTVSILVDSKSLPSTQELVKMVKSSKGRWFSCEFIKADGEVRKMVARTGVKKHLKGVGKARKENLLTVYETRVGYRTINVDTLKSFKIGNFEYKVGGGCQ